MYRKIAPPGKGHLNQG